ncbi:hypothetical protein BSIN_1242 [Burkholderia singularis]|uniref:Uncharacterized protein n=1 Tax=Burkholderia singularis TaxID=1503053 RepID=A0A238HDE5_9BURK|nr:hypothetical protein BSIN_1242 [Burkholderia singularis]
MRAARRLARRAACAIATPTCAFRMPRCNRRRARPGVRARPAGARETVQSRPCGVAPHHDRAARLSANGCAAIMRRSGR